MLKSQYITTSRELLEQLGAETTSEGISSIAKGKLNVYSDRIEELPARLASKVPGDDIGEEHLEQGQSSLEAEQIRSTLALSSGLRRRLAGQVEAEQPTISKDAGAPFRLDAAAQAHIEKHRMLQEGSIDEMVELVRRLKDTSLLMNQSVQDSEKILDSTERAVTHSLVGTGLANAQAVEVYSLTSKATCLQWLLLFIMTWMFVMGFYLYGSPEDIRH